MSFDLLRVICVVGMLAWSGCAVAPPPPPAKVPLSQLLSGLQAENAALQQIYDSGSEAGRTLGALNGKLQSVGYFRRIPSQPSVELLQTALRKLAVQKLLQIAALEVPAPAEAPPPAPAQVVAGARWKPPLEAFRGTVQVGLDLIGRPADVAAFVDALPEQVDRLLVVTDREPLAGGMRLRLEGYYEKPLPQPDVVLQWPGLQERLVAAGWDPADPALARDPLLGKLREQVELGQKRLPDVRRVLQISADFPRWQLRWQFFSERAKVEIGTHGAQVIGR